MAGTRSGRRKNLPSLIVWLVVILLVAGLAVFDNLGDSSTTVPAPEAAERTDTVPILAGAAASQGICYGWRLDDSTSTVNAGSNLGDGIPIDQGDPRCPRWVEVTVDVHYAPASSEAADSSSLTVITSHDLAFVATSDDFKRFGLDEDAFIDDPGWATCRAATMLPLLVAEAGVADPVPPPNPDANPAASDRLPDAGSDFWRDRWPYLIAAGVLLLAAGAMLAAGWTTRRRQGDQP